MAATPSRNHHHPNQPSTSKPPKPTHNPNHQTLPNSQQNSEPNPYPSTTTTTSSNPSYSFPSPFTLSQQDQFLSRSTHLTHLELLKRRSHNLKQLSKCYRDHYWALMEDLKARYRDYYWNYGVSPFKVDQTHVTHQRKSEKGGGFMSGEVGSGGDFKVEVVAGENDNSNCNGFRGFNNNHRCLFVGCKLKAMALTSFCHLHILSDAKQKLYEPCGYVIKSSQAGPLTCGKPVLRSTTPALCAIHFQKAQKHVTRALKKAGLPSSSSKLAPKFHIIVAEYIHQIQAKRRVAERVNSSKVVDKEAGDTRATWSSCT